MALALRGVPQQLHERLRALCSQPPPNFAEWRTPAPPAKPIPEQAPMQVFDQLFFVGDQGESVWALKTPAGLILVDSSFADRVRPVVEAGLVKLGLDPADIKYVIVTHGHDDHYGGSAYLQQRYGAHVMMGAADWQVKPDPGMKGIRDPMPRRDLDAADVTLGGVTVRVIATPGHTPGTVSLLIPVTDKGEPHVAALWGGGFPLATLDLAKAYARSAASFAEVARATGADVFLSNHPSNDESLVKMKALSQRQPADANPFVIGREAVVQRFMFTDQCAQAYVALHAR